MMRFQGACASPLPAGRERACRQRLLLLVLTGSLLLLGASGQQAQATPQPETQRMVADVALLAGYGPRPAGSAGEQHTAAIIAGRLRALGYTVTRQPFTLPDGRRSANVIAEQDAKGTRLLVGAHYDSHRCAPGADDNASGIAVLLETARLLAGRALPVRFVAFGAEEIYGGNRLLHHFGSRFYVHSARREELRALRGMLCVDCVGNSEPLRIVTMPRGDDRLARRCREIARTYGVRIRTGRGTSLSDHEAFARAGVPVALYCAPSRYRHTPHDTVLHISPARLREAAQALVIAVDALCRDNETRMAPVSDE